MPALFGFRSLRSRKRLLSVVLLLAAAGFPISPAAQEGALDRLTVIRDGESRAITGENPTGAKGEGGKAASNLGPGRKGKPAIAIPAGKSVTLAEIKGPGVIRHIWITVPPPPREFRAGPNVWRDTVIRMYWDGSVTPCVEGPLGDFFGMGQGASVSLTSSMVTIAEGRGLNCYWPMPFAKSARIEVDNQGPNNIDMFFFQIDYELVKKLDRDTGRFHAQWRRENPTILKKDYTLLEATGRGHYVGTMLSLVPLSGNWWGEGEMKFFLDGDQEHPTIAGTGLEDYFGSAWGIGEYHSPYLGAPLVNNGRASMYRWHVHDPIRFKKNIRVTMQNIGYRNGLYERSDDMCSTAYWYQDEPHQRFPPLPDVNARRPREPALK